MGRTGLNRSGSLKTSVGAWRFIVWVVGFQFHVSELLQIGGGRGGVVGGSVNTLSLPSNPYLGLSKAKW